MWWIIGIIVVWYTLYRIYGTDKAKIKRSLREHEMIWVNGVWYVIGVKGNFLILTSPKHGTILTKDITTDREVFIAEATDAIIALETKQ